MKHRINRLECSSLGKARICFCFSKSLGEEIFGESLKDGQCTSQYFSLVALPINGCRAASLRARLARGAEGRGGECDLPGFLFLRQVGLCQAEAEARHSTVGTRQW